MAGQGERRRFARSSCEADRHTIKRGHCCARQKAQRPARQFRTAATCERAKAHDESEPFVRTNYSVVDVWTATLEVVGWSTTGLIFSRRQPSGATVGAAGHCELVVSAILAIVNGPLDSTLRTVR